MATTNDPDALCPDCHHPVSIHDDFFCMHVNCYCNHSRLAARALYERDLYKTRVDELVNAMKKIYEVALKLQQEINQSSGVGE